MFDVDIVPKGDLFSVRIGDKEIALCDEQRANFWRCITRPDKVFVSCDVAICFNEEPIQLCKFRITQAEMEAFLSQVMYTFDHIEHEHRVGWVEIDPGLMRTFRLGAEEIIETCDMWLDEDGAYPHGEPFILIHPDRNTQTGESFIEMMYVVTEVYHDKEKESPDI